MDKIEIFQELVIEELQAGVKKIFNGLTNRRADKKLAHETHTLLVQHFQIFVKKFDTNEPILLTCYPEKGNIIITALNLTTAALMHGFNIDKKIVIDNDLFTFWEFASGVLRFEKATATVAIIPLEVYKSLDLNSLLT